MSLGAQGSIGQVVTFRRTRRQAVALELPTHPDARTIDQRYHRWNYQDACFYWHTLSAASKAVYAALASGQNYTGFNVFIADYLATLPDLALLLHLDRVTGGLVIDSSLQGNDGTLFGPTLEPGLIYNCLSFDGIDDYVSCGSDPSLDINTFSAFTYEAWVRLDSTLVDEAIISKGKFQDMWFDKVELYWFCYVRDISNDSFYAKYTQEHPVAGTWYLLDGVWDGSELSIWVNAVKGAVTAAPASLIDTSADDLTLGWRLDIAEYLHGKIDEIRIYNRALSPDQIFAHYLRVRG